MLHDRFTREAIFLRENRIGTVCQVGPSQVRFIAGGVANGSSAHSLGEYLVIDCGTLAVIGQLTDMSSDNGRGNGEAQTLGQITLLTTLHFSDGSVVPGVITSPQIGSEIYRASAKLITYVLDSGAELRGVKLARGQDAVTLSFAKLADRDRTPIAITPEQLFGSHCAIIGSSGGGKSWTIARLIQECSQYRSKVILLDPSGEFETLTDNTKHVYIGTDPLPGEGAVEVVLPYYELTEMDLFAIFRPEGQSQAPKLRAAMESLKLARLEPMMAPDGTILKADRSKIEFLKALRYHLAAIEHPLADFDITKLSRQIVNECVHPNRSAVEPQYWGGINGSDQAQCMFLVTRIDDIIKSRSLAPLFQPSGKPSLFAEIDQFLTTDTHRVLRIALQYLSTSHHAREIVANAIGRYVFELAKEGKFRDHPLLVVVDEAHRFLNERLNDRTLLFPLDAFASIAKEGRKYAINICLSTQRPQDIPEDVLSQVGSMIVHRIISDQDLRVVERASGALDKSSSISLPRLVPGEAVIIGMAFPVPLNILVDYPDHPPNSRGPDFQRCWR